jgi:hypothetical protein
MVSKPETIFWLTRKMVSMVKWRIKALPIGLSISGHFSGDQLTIAHEPTLIHTDAAADYTMPAPRLTTRKEKLRLFSALRHIPRS